MKIMPAQYKEVDELFEVISQHGKQVVTVTSLRGQEAVSSLILSLANRFVLADNKVLILDLNSCHAQLSELFHYPLTETGLFTHWRFDDISCQLAVQNFEWMGNAGSRISRLHNLQFLSHLALSSDVEARDHSLMNEAILRLRAEFDLILIDATPVLEVNQSNIVANLPAACSDLVLLNIGLGRHQDLDLLQAQRELNIDQDKLLAVITQTDQPPLADLLKQQLLQGRASRFIPGVLRQFLLRVIAKQHWLQQNPGA